MDKAKEISALWKQIKPQVGELVRLCREVEDHAEVTADAYQRGYEQGRKDGKSEGQAETWEAARKIAYYSREERIYLFKEAAFAGVFEHKLPDEAIEKIRQYEYEQEKEEQIQTGDEVIYDGRRCVVIAPETTERYGSVMDAEGRRYVFENKEVENTGRHFPELVELLRKMKEEK